jgi:predicted acylesterase/phospholipase RssA
MLFATSVSGDAQETAYGGRIFQRSEREAARRRVRPVVVSANDEQARCPRDVAVVLSGGSVNGVLMEIGFLKRLRESSLWPRVGAIFGTSAGALAGFAAAVDELDRLEEFALALRPEETFRPQPLWRLPLRGSHDYALPRTVAERLGDPLALARRLAGSERELVVCATDLRNGDVDDGAHSFELVYSSKRVPPEEMVRAVFASGAITGLVLPVEVGGRIATDGGWVRNYPLAYAYDQPDVELIVSFRYLPRYPRVGTAALASLRARLERFGRVLPVRAVVAELREAEERERRGQPAHLVDVILRLMQVVVMRNTVLEELRASEKDSSIRELRALRADIDALVRETCADHAERERLARAIGERFASAAFPFRHDRLVSRIMVQGSAGELSLEPGFRTQKPWTEMAKRTLIRRGYDLADRELRACGVDSTDGSPTRVLPAAA